MARSQHGYRVVTVHVMCSRFAVGLTSVAVAAMLLAPVFGALQSLVCGPSSSCLSYLFR